MPDETETPPGGPPAKRAARSVRFDNEVSVREYGSKGPLGEVTKRKLTPELQSDAPNEDATARTPPPIMSVTRTAPPANRLDSVILNSASSSQPFDPYDIDSIDPGGKDGRFAQKLLSGADRDGPMFALDSEDALASAEALMAKALAFKSRRKAQERDEAGGALKTQEGLPKDADRSPSPTGALDSQKAPEPPNVTTRATRTTPLPPPKDSGLDSKEALASSQNSRDAIRKRIQEKQKERQELKRQGQGQGQGQQNELDDLGR